MPDTSYGIGEKNLDAFLQEVATGIVQLPDFQRGWVWDDRHIRSLLKSISLAYPIGAVMMLEANDRRVTDETVRDLLRFKPRPLEGAPKPIHPAEELILDGQQRLTSLFQALLSGKPVEMQNQRKRWYYIDMNMALDDEIDREEAIFSIRENLIEKGRNKIRRDYSKTEYEYKDMVFPLRYIFDPHNWADGFKDYWSEHGRGEQGKSLWNTFDRSVVDNFKSCRLPVIKIGKDTPKEAICQVFEKVNTAGVKLTVFELLTAMFAAEGFNLKEDWEAREKQLKETLGLSVLSKVSGTDFLQAVTLLATREQQERERKKGNPRPPGISCKRADILSLTRKEYDKWADLLMKGFEWAAFFLHDQKVRAKFLPYGSQLIPLAAIRTVLNKDKLTGAERDKLAQWYWCGVFGELYGGSIESRFALDLPQVVEWMSGGKAVPLTVQEARFDRKRLLSLQSLRSAAYKGVHSLILRQGAYDWITGANVESFEDFEKAVEIHHIFPQRWCNAQNPAIKEDRRDSIVNKTPLFYWTNKKLGGQAPSKYAAAIQSEAGGEIKLDNHLKTHCIDPGLLRKDEFNKFFEARRQALIALIEQAMGKRVFTDDTEEGDDEDEYDDEE